MLARPENPVCFHCSVGSASLLPRTETCFSWKKVGCISGKGLICLLLFCKIFEATGPRSTQSNSTEASPKGFSLEKLFSKAHQQTEGTFLLLRGGKCTELCLHTCTPTGCYCGGLCFHTNVNFERKVKGASALYCVYILKNKVLYVFITLIIVIKSLPFLICGLGGFLFVCFPVWGFCLFFCFCFSGQKNLLLVFVLLLVRTLKY